MFGKIIRDAIEEEYGFNYIEKLVRDEVSHQERDKDRSEIEKTAYEYIHSEAFLDEIVERLLRKQIK